jgi:hypothetical protein
MVLMCLFLTIVFVSASSLYKAIDSRHRVIEVSFTTLFTISGDVTILDGIMLKLQGKPQRIVMDVYIFQFA